MTLTIENVLREINAGLDMARKAGVGCGPITNLSVTQPSHLKPVTPSTPQTNHGGHNG